MSDRTYIYQNGALVGSIPAGQALRSRSFVFDIRFGDFRRRADGGYDAHPSICPGDFEALAGFRYEQRA
jgi:hypothetical protein